MRTRPLFIAVAAVVGGFGPCLGQGSIPLFRVNCGGPTVVASNGATFLGDAPYSTATGFGYVGGSPVQYLSEIGPLDNPLRSIDQTGRDGFSAYRFDVPNGSYRVHLHFCEIASDMHASGLRVFDIALEDTPVLDAFDPVATFGLQYAGECVFPCTVSDGKLDLTATARVGRPLLNGIEIYAHSHDSIAPIAPTQFVAHDGIHRTWITFDPPTEADVVAHRVERSLTPSGPYVALATIPRAPPRYHDDTAPQGTPCFYRVRSIDASGNLSPSSFFDTATAQDSQAANLPIYRLTISATNLQALGASVFAAEPAEVPGSFEFDSKTWAVTVKFRGGNSKRYSKKSFKIKFSAADSFHGLRELNLKAYFVDSSFEREPIEIALLHALRHPAAKERPVALELNGEYLGLYHDIEELDDNWLLAHDRAATVSLWKAEGNLTPLQSLAQYEASYEQKTGTEMSPLVDFIQFLATTPSGKFEHALLERFDVNGYLDYLSVIGFLSDLDSVTHNFYLAFDPSLERYEIVAWDGDLCFGMSSFVLHPWPELAVDFGTLGSIHGPSAGFGFNALKDRVLAVPSFRYRYARKLEALAATLGSPAALQQTIDERHLLIRDAAHADPFKWGYEKSSLFDLASPMLGAFAAPRMASITQQLATYSPIATSSNPPLVINEFEAFPGPNSSLLDESGEREPWIELWNASNTSFDASGCFLSDDRTHLTKWALPSGTVIPPGGRVIVYADSELAEGPLHAPLALKEIGGAIRLIAADGNTLLDFVDYDPGQQVGVSECRVPDGGAFFSSSAVPTPGTANVASGSLPLTISGVHATPTTPQAGNKVEIECFVTGSESPISVDLVWRVDGDAWHSIGMSALPFQRYVATIPGQPARTHVDYYIRVANGSGVMVVKPAAAPTNTFHLDVANSPATGLFITEIVADNSRSFLDEAGDAEDWIEVANLTDHSIDASGLFLTDNLAQTTRFEIPGGTILAPQQRIVIVADDESAEGPLHANFKLSKSGEQIGLFDSLANGNALIDGFSFGAQTTDVSLGRLPDSGVLLFRLLDPNPGDANIPMPGSSRRYTSTILGENSLQLVAESAVLGGKKLRLSLGTGAANSSAAWLIGTNSLDYPFAPEGTVLVFPFTIVSAIAGPTGTTTLLLDISPDPGTIGLTLWFQGHLSQSGLSNGLAATIGS